MPGDRSLTYKKQSTLLAERQQGTIFTTLTLFCIIKWRLIIKNTTFAANNLMTLYFFRKKYLAKTI